MMCLNKLKSAKLGWYCTFSKDVAVLKFRFELFTLGNGRKNNDDGTIYLFNCGNFNNSGHNDRFI